MMGNHDDSVRIVDDADAAGAAVKLIIDYAQGTLNFSSFGDFRARSIWRQRQNRVDLCLRPWIGDADAFPCRWNNSLNRRNVQKKLRPTLNYKSSSSMILVIVISEVSTQLA